MRKYYIQIIVTAADPGKFDTAQLHLPAEMAESAQDIVKRFTDAPQGTPEPLKGIPADKPAELVAATPAVHVSEPTGTEPPK